MFRPWSAKTRRTASSVPGSLRTATTSVVRRAVRRRRADGGGRRPGGRGRGSGSGCPAGRRSRRRAPRDRTAPAARGESTAAAPRSPRVGDGLAGTGGVVGRQQLPRPRPQERLGLAEGLDVRVDPLDVVDAAGRAAPPGTGSTGTTTSPRMTRSYSMQQVVVLADRAVDDVLDRDDAGRGLAARRPRRTRPGSCPSGVARHVPERREDGVLGEGAGLPGVGHDRRVGQRAGESSRADRRSAVRDR